MTFRIATTLIIALAVLLPLVDASAEKIKEKDTIKSLERQHIDVRPGKVIVNSSSLARDNYRAFLDLVSDDPELSAEAMRRRCDLELEAAEAEQLSDNIGRSSIPHHLILFILVKIPIPHQRRFRFDLPEF